MRKERALRIQVQRQSKTVTRVQSATSSPTLPLSVLDTLQHTVGNRAVQRMLIQGKLSAGTLQRAVWDPATWLDQSNLTNIFGKDKKRSGKLDEVDKALEKYDRVRDDPNLETQYAALKELKSKLEAWARFKGSDSSGEVDSDRVAAYKQLYQQVSAEMIQVATSISGQQAEEQARARSEATQRLMEEFITPEISTIVDKREKAKAIFEAFVKYGQGKYKYKTSASGDLLQGAKEGACGSFARVLASIFTEMGIAARPVKIPQTYFMTKRLRELDFIDPACPGNVKAEGQPYLTVNRFFFSEHWICDTEVGKFDPTSGIAFDVDKGIDATLQGFREVQRGVYRLGDRYELRVIQNDAYSGSGYELKVLTT
jgi:hypothetical protein